jgi:hypothetical protein
MNFLTDEAGKSYNRFYPMPTADVTLSSDVTAVSGETVNFKAGAAGFKGIEALNKNKIANVRGDKIGSFWKELQNLMVENSPLMSVTAITETDGSAAVTVYVNPVGPSNVPNLEQLFEISSGNSQYVMLLTDPIGNELYGYIRGVAVSGNSYTFTVNNTLAGGVQNWIGTLASFDSSLATRCGFKIFSYESSLVFTTGTILLQEKAYDPAKSDTVILNEILTVNGDYAVDYVNGRIFYRKATTGTSDTVAYNTRSLSVGGGGSSGDPLFVQEVNAPAYEDNDNGVARTARAYNYVNISTATTTAIKATPGLLGGISVLDTLVGTVTINDGANTIAVLPVGTTAGFYELPFIMLTDIEVVTSSADDIVVAFL